MALHMDLVTNGSVFKLTRSCLSSPGIGASLAIAMAARMSIIRLIHSSYRIENGLMPSDAPPRITIQRQDMLTVSWNCKNFFTLSNTLRPHLTALKIELKSSSRSVISASYLATSDPTLPMAKPTEAAERALASLNDLPV